MTTKTILVDGHESFTVDSMEALSENLGAGDRTIELTLNLTNGTSVVISARYDRAVGGAYLEITECP